MWTCLPLANFLFATAGHNIGFARLLKSLVRGAVCVTIAEQEDR